MTFTVIIVLLFLTAAIFSYCEYSKRLQNELMIHFFDVGQGDAALIVTDGATILIDAGTNESENKLVSYIQRLGVRNIDCAVFSHPHEDHIGGADQIFEFFNVRNAILPDLFADSRSYELMMEGIAKEKCAVYEAFGGQTFTFGEVTLTVLSPVKAFGDLNLDCAVIMIEYGDAEILFTGDLEGGAETFLVDEYGEKLDADVLKVGHHGSSSGTMDEFLDAVTPEIAVISCGVNNDYGHPHTEVLQRLGKRNVTVKRTDTEHTVTVVTDGVKVWVE